MHYTRSAYAALILVVLGVVLATGAPAQEQPPSASSSPVPVPFSAILLTLLGAFLASLKSITAAQLQRKPISVGSLPTSSRSGSSVGIGLGPLELIQHISPLACLSALLLAWENGEVEHPSLLFATPSLSYFARAFSLFARSVSPSEKETDTNTNLSHTSFPPPLFLPPLLILNVLTALALNIVSFEANRRVGALGITIAGNVKQVLLIVVAGDLVEQGGGEMQKGWGKQEQLWWRWIGVIGVLCTVGGSIWWAVEEGRRKTRRSGGR